MEGSATVNMMKDKTIEKFRIAFDNISRSLVQSQKVNEELVEKAKKSSRKLINYSREMNKFAAIKKEDDKTISQLTAQVEKAWTQSEQATQQEKLAGQLTRKLKLEIKKMTMEVNEMYSQIKVLKQELVSEKAKNADIVAGRATTSKSSNSNIRSKKNVNPSNNAIDNKKTFQKSSHTAIAFSNDNLTNGTFAKKYRSIKDAATRSGQKHKSSWERAIETKKMLPDAVRHLSHIQTPMGIAKNKAIPVQYKRLPSLKQNGYKT